MGIEILVEIIFKFMLKAFEFTELCFFHRDLKHFRSGLFQDFFRFVQSFFITGTQISAEDADPFPRSVFCQGFGIVLCLAYKRRAVIRIFFGKNLQDDRRVFDGCAHRSGCILYPADRQNAGS